ncbi:unnamed protein product [Ectocarpus sp. CCAP 1310/34]|nr:unnamed protein product [Ectocarpus sp. CCAP 1310/34]
MDENKATSTAQPTDNNTLPVYNNRTNDVPSTRSSSSSPTSSCSSSRVTPYSGQDQLDAQLANSSVSSESPALHDLNTPGQAAAAGTKEGSGPYPLRPRPTHGAVVKQALSIFKSSASQPSIFKSSASQPGGPGVRVLSTSPSSPAHTAVPPAKEPPIPMHCQHRGCSNLARYGPLDSPPRACQLHKRVGQFTTNRHGALFRATREGNAFRKLAAATVKSPPPCSINKGDLVASDQSRLPSTGSSGASSSSSHPKPEETSGTRGQVLKRANRQGISGGHNGGSQSSRNRTCLFPGCDARPDYGLPGATRAMYCFAHKKAPMVQLFKELPALPNKAGNATTGKRSQGPAAAAAAAAAASVGANKTRAPSNIDRNGAKKARRGPQETEEDNDVDSGGKHTSKKRRSTGGKDERGGISSAKVTGENLTKPTVKTSASSLPPPAPAFEPNPPSSSNNRLADSSGMAPSVEFLVLRQAREAAKTEAEASGLGRRPRAPSRRALEAAGRLKGIGAQWMSREKKAEDLRLKAELRLQRKQYQAAGLKSGVVLEMFVPAATGTEAAGDGIEQRDGEVRGEGGATTPRGSNPGWHKVSPEALSAPSSKQHGSGQGKGSSVGRRQKPSKQARSTAVAESG